MSKVLKQLLQEDREGQGARHRLTVAARHEQVNLRADASQGRAPP